MFLRFILQIIRYAGAEIKHSGRVSVPLLVAVSWLAITAHVVLDFLPHYSL